MAAQLGFQVPAWPLYTAPRGRVGHRMFAVLDAPSFKILSPLPGLTPGDIGAFSAVEATAEATPIRVRLTSGRDSGTIMVCIFAVFNAEEPMLVVRGALDDLTFGAEFDPASSYDSGTRVFTLIPNNGWPSGSVALDFEVIGGGAAATEFVNEAPVPEFSFASVLYETITLLNETTDEDDGLTYLWDFGDGNTSTLTNPSHTYAAAGTYTVTLTATDVDGLAVSIDHDQAVVANDPPVAGFSHVVTDRSVAFTDTSTDSDGTIVSWLWDFGDGETSTEQNPTHIYIYDTAYPSGVTWPVQLTVTDDGGATDDVTNNVNIAAIPTVAFNLWSNVAPATTPTARRSASMCFFPGIGIIMVGGTGDGTNAIHDSHHGVALTCACWRWTGTDWVKMTPPTEPRSGFGGSLVYSEVERKAFFVCAFDGGYTSYVSVFDGTTWTNNASNGPGASVWGCGAYDAARETVVYNWGFSTLDTSEYADVDAAASYYTSADPAGSISYRAAMSRSPTTGAALLTGGNAGGTATDLWNGTTWAASVATPAAMGDGAFAGFNYIRNTAMVKRIAALGTYEFNGTTWSKLVLSNEGPTADSSCMAFNETDGKMILFGGIVGGVYKSETWRQSA